MMSPLRWRTFQKILGLKNKTCSRRSNWWRAYIHQLLSLEKNDSRSTESCSQQLPLCSTRTSSWLPAAKKGPRKSPTCMEWNGNWHSSLWREMTKGHTVAKVKGLGCQASASADCHCIQFLNRHPPTHRGRAKGLSPLILQLAFLDLLPSWEGWQVKGKFPKRQTLLIRWHWPKLGQHDPIATSYGWTAAGKITVPTWKGEAH